MHETLLEPIPAKRRRRPTGRSASDPRPCAHLSPPDARCRWWTRPAAPRTACRPSRGRCGRVEVRLGGSGCAGSCRFDSWGETWDPSPTQHGGDPEGMQAIQHMATLQEGRGT
eukprot:scaffold1771_cov343-Pavlova_lutheri.AAC.29